MISRIMEMLRDPLSLVIFLLTIPAAMLALSVHESAHGLAAYKLGDPTARNFGRISLNPAKHFDVIGFLALLFFQVGWAKPVPINARNFKNPRRGMALSAAAGPASNFLLGIVGTILLYLTYALCRNTAETFGVVTQGQLGLWYGYSLSTMSQKIVFVLLLFLYQFSALNIGLALFNLIPVPPFDGSRVAYVFLPSKWYFGIMRYERYIMIGMILIIFSLSQFNILGMLINGVLSGIGWLIERIPVFRFIG